MANDELFTPKWVFDELKLIFDLDVCAPVGGAKDVPAIEYFDEESNGLTANWFGLVWMNPPFSKPAPWVEKWLNHGNGVALLPFAKSSWFNELWDSEAKCLPLKSSIKFINPLGVVQSIWMPVGLWGIGDVSISAMERGNFNNVR